MADCWSPSNCLDCLQASNCAWSQWDYCFPSGESGNGNSINSQAQCPTSSNTDSVNIVAIVLSVIAVVLVIGGVIVGCWLYKRKPSKSKSYESVNKDEENDNDEVAINNNQLESECKQEAESEIEEQKLDLIPKMQDTKQIVQKSMSRQEGVQQPTIDNDTYQ